MRGPGIKVRTEIDLRGVEEKLSKRNLERARYAMANQMLADMNRFVPMDQGFLRQTGHVAPDGQELTWRTVYAKAMFHGSRPFRRGMPVDIFMWSNNSPTTPGTGARWDLAAKEVHVKDWLLVYARGGGFL